MGKVKYFNIVTRTGQSASVRCFGYEPFCLQWLLKTNNIQDIYYGRNAKESEHFGGPIPKFAYFDPTRQKHRTYFPDFYLPKEHKIIEVKSEYYLYKDYRTNIAKKLACCRAGYLFEFHVYDQFGRRLRHK